MEKVEVEVASDVVVKTEEKEMLDEVSPDDVVDEAEVKVESPALEKGQQTCRSIAAVQTYCDCRIFIC